MCMVSLPRIGPPTASLGWRRALAALSPVTELFATDELKKRTVTGLGCISTWYPVRFQWKVSIQRLYIWPWVKKWILKPPQIHESGEGTGRDLWVSQG